MDTKRIKLIVKDTIASYLNCSIPLKNAKITLVRVVKNMLKPKRNIKFLDSELPGIKTEVIQSKINAIELNNIFIGTNFWNIFSGFSILRATSVVIRISNPKSANTKNIDERVCAAVKLPKISTPKYLAIIINRSEFVTSLENVEIKRYKEFFWILLVSEIKLLPLPKINFS